MFMLMMGHRRCVVLLIDLPRWKEEIITKWSSSPFFNEVETYLHSCDRVFNEYKNTQDRKLKNLIKRLCFIIPHYDRLKQMTVEGGEAPSLDCQVNDVRSWFAAWRYMLPDPDSMFSVIQDQFRRNYTLIEMITQEVSRDYDIVDQKLEEIQESITDISMYLLFADLQNKQVYLPDVPQNPCKVLQKYHVDKVVNFFVNMKFPGINCYTD